MKKIIFLFLVVFLLATIPFDSLEAKQGDSKLIDKIEQKIEQGFKNDYQKLTLINKIKVEIQKIEKEINKLEKKLDNTKNSKKRDKIEDEIKNLQNILEKLQTLLNQLIIPRQLLLKWGSYGDAAGEFNLPRAITIDTNGNVYIADSSTLQLQKFSSNGVFLKEWGPYRYTYAPGTFGGICGLATDSQNNIYVAECSDARSLVQKFTSDGEFLYALGSNIRGTEEGQFAGHQNDVAVDSNDNIYVLDAGGNYGVHIFSSTGEFITRWGPFGDAPLREPYEDWELRSPSGIAIDNQNNVYITDGNRLIKKFTKDGIFITKWGIDEFGWNLFGHPMGLAIDNNDNIYVVDSSCNNIQVFTNDGEFLAILGSYGSGDWQFNSPYDIAIDLKSNSLYVADSGNHRIQKFRP